jgi:hypothetical protein
MARYSVSWVSKTMIAVADTTNYTNAGYCTYILPGSSTQLIKVNEVYIGGEDTASTPTTMVFARDHVVATTAFSGSFITAMDVQTTAPTLPNVGSTSTALPQRLATGHLLGLSLNTYGGIARWQARYGEEITQYGTAVDVGQTSLSSVTGTGKCSGHVIIEIV